jgi:lipopolysaccharide export system permease protein
MLHIKKLDIFIVKSFSLLFIGTFLICLFIFMMQFLWRYVDELVGKGLGMDVLGKFFFYSSLTLVPAALPLAILLASLITFGNFGERFELLAMKAAGISLLKVMRPLMVVVVLLSGVSFYFQNVISPESTKQLGTLVISLKQKSPELDIPENAFYSEIEGFNLRVKKKNKKTGMLYDVLIYDHSGGFDNTRIIYSDSGRIDMTADRKYLNVTLFKGELFENLRSQAMYSANVPYRRESFKLKTFIIDFNSGFNMADASIMGNQAGAKNMAKLQSSIDSMKLTGDSIGKNYYKTANEGFYREVPMALSKVNKQKMSHTNLANYNVDNLYDAASVNDKHNILQHALNSAQSVGADWSFKSSTMEELDSNIRRHETEWHKKLTISLSCLIFFFIGAPLGGIIRKGGLGMPVVISVLIFIIYYIIDNSGYKMARDGKWIVWMGMWTSTAILAPLGAFLTYKSNTDSVVMNIDTYIAWFRRVAGIRSTRHLFLKEVVIHDPDYDKVPDQLSNLTAQCRSYVKGHRLKSIPNYFSLWMSDRYDSEIDKINDDMEQLIEELSNTKSSILLNTLESYPVIPPHAHTRPFHIYWLNVAAGIIVPIGLFFMCRIWAFRIRLNKDLERIVSNDKKVLEIIDRIKTKNNG